MFCINAMRVTREILNNKNNLSMYGEHTKHRHRQTGLITQNYSSQNELNNNQIRPAERASLSGSEHLNGNISFTGDPKMVTNIAKTALSKAGVGELPGWADKMGGAKWFSSVLNSVNKNETFYEAFVALVVAGMLKPICVVAMPGAKMEDKQMSATKNAASAIVGFGLSNLILSPCSNAVNKINKSINSTDAKEITKYIKDKHYIDQIKSEELLSGMKSTIGDSFKTTFKKAPDMIVTPLKASIAIALTPYLLDFIFGKRKKEKAEKEKLERQNKPNAFNPDMTIMNTLRIKKPSNVQNTNFEGKNKNNSISFTGAKENLDNNSINNSPSFTGIFKPLGVAKEAYCNALAEPIAKAMGYIAGTKPAQWLVKTFARFEKPSARWSDMASFAITYFYINNTKKSDKIPEERKLPLMINNFMVTVASSTAAFLIDKYTDKPMENLLKSYLKNNEQSVYEKSNKGIINALTAAVEGGQELDKDALLRHADKLIDEDNMSDAFRNAVEELKNNKTVQKAITNGKIAPDEIAKMAASGFESQASKIYKVISKTKSLTVFTLTVRFLVTVLMVPVIGKVVEIVNKKLGKDNDDDDKKLKASKNNDKFDDDDDDDDDDDNKNIIIPPVGSETIGMYDFMHSLNK